MNMQNFMNVEDISGWSLKLFFKKYQWSGREGTKIVR